MAAFLITGRPGSGKTTLLRDIVEALAAPTGGFYTRELRDASGARTGFEIVTLDGATAVLADVALDTTHRVGRYGVDIDAIERVAVPAVEAAVAAGHLVVIDEIGKMELLSPKFQRAVIEAVRRHRVLFGTIMQASHPFADELKAQPDVILHELRDDNRDRLRALIEAQLLGALGRFTA
jgi:nucleoside-triphosphatase